MLAHLEVKPSVQHLSREHWPEMVEANFAAANVLDHANLL